MGEWLNRLQHIDRRILYLLTVLVVATPFMTRMSLPINPTPPVRRAYSAVDRVPKDKIVILVANWEAGTRGESAPQTEAVIRHMFRKGIRFAIFSHNNPPGPTFAEQIADRLAAQMGKTYGVDWINWGYRPGTIAMIQGLARDIPAIIGEDIKGKPITSYPVMRGIRSMKDVGLVVDVASAFTISLWIQYVQRRYGTTLIFAPTAVMIAETYPYLASGQLTGTIPGLRGAAEYDTLLGVSGYARRAMNAQSMAHLLIIFLIVLGNIGYISARRKGGAS